MSDPTLALPFDQYQRYRLVADILAEVQGKRKRLDVLDVGGRTALLRKFMPKARVFLVDVEASDEKGLVLGDGSRLPFATGSVDAVVAFDTLEHVPPKGRADFLAECRRVAKSWVVVAGPYNTEGVEQAESLLTTFLLEKMRVKHRYLAEHKENGLPNLAETEAALGSGGARLVSIGHANLERWLALMCLELYMDRDAPLRAIASKYYEFYNATLYASDHARPVYRHAVVAAYGDAALPAPKKLLDPPIAPKGTFKSFQSLLQELVSFDVDRDVIQPEWDRLERVNADLLLDLEGHKDTLMILQEINVEQRQVIAELRQKAIDIVGEEDALLGEVEDLKSILDHERAEQREVISTLSEDLAGHRTVVETKTEEIARLTLEARRLEAALAFERSESLEVLKTLNEDLAGHRAVVKSQAADLAEQQRVARELESTLALERAAQNQVIQSLSEDLDGHRSVVKTQATELELRQKVVRELEATLAIEREEQAKVVQASNKSLAEHRLVAQALSEDLAGHRLVVKEQAQEIERLTAVLAQERKEQALALQVIAQDLDGHRALVAALRADIEAYQRNQNELKTALSHERGRTAELEDIAQHQRSELVLLANAVEGLSRDVEQRNKTIGELVAARQQMEAQVHQLNLTLGEKQGALDTVRSELSHQRQIVDGLRAELRDRWRNLMRGVGLK